MRRSHDYQINRIKRIREKAGDGMDKWNKPFVGETSCSNLISNIDNEAKWIELIFSHGGEEYFTVFLFFFLGS